MTTGRIVIIGPESTGKSTLCKQLAAYFKTTWCAEYARAYLLEHGMNYSFNDLLVIARRQYNLDMETVAEAERGNKPFVFIDTDMFVMKVWCEFVFGKCHSWIIRRAAEQPADMYLLCNTDLPWTKDELREYPDPATRQKLFSYYKDIVVNSGVPWALVSGNEDERLVCAIEAMEKQLNIEQGILNVEKIQKNAISKTPVYPDRP
jgi:NadR type nicotinamide-nucleotide adenylyltransferase